LHWGNWQHFCALRIHTFLNYIFMYLGSFCIKVWLYIDFVSFRKHFVFGLINILLQRLNKKRLALYFLCTFRYTSYLNGRFHVQCSECSDRLDNLEEKHLRIQADWISALNSPFIFINFNHIFIDLWQFMLHFLIL
jgi:hypothetical protein